MNTYYKEQCSDYLMRKKYKPCINSSKINSDFIKYIKKIIPFFVIDNKIGNIKNHIKNVEKRISLNAGLMTIWSLVEPKLFKMK